VAQIRELIALRFPRPQLEDRVIAISSESGAAVEQVVSKPPGVSSEVVSKPPAPKTTPLSAEWIGLQFSVSRKAHEKFRYAQSLMSHRARSGDLAAAFERIVELAIPKLEQQKFGGTTGGRRSRGAKSGGRYIPKAIQREVWVRDEGRCTFVSEDGRRCEACDLLEFDHVDGLPPDDRPITAKDLRLLCRTHNQYEAERRVGAEFMRHKREQARLAAKEARARKSAKAKAAAERAAEAARAEAEAVQRAKDVDVVPWLRRLGYRATEAREAAKRCDSIPDAPLEQRIRVALSYFRPHGTHKVSHAATTAA